MGSSGIETMHFFNLSVFHSVSLTLKKKDRTIGMKGNASRMILPPGLAEGGSR